MRNKITIRNSIFVNRPPDEVWDFTQDYKLRTSWDKTVKEAKIIQEEPSRKVWIKTTGDEEVLFKYKLERRPEKTSLVMMESNSYWFKGGGGSWVYYEKNGGTNWVQTNTVVLRKGLLGRLAKPLVAILLKWNTGQAMKRAKKIIEKM